MSDRWILTAAAANAVYLSNAGDGGQRRLALGTVR